jgi:hypothetical protein
MIDRLVLQVLNQDHLFDAHNSDLWNGARWQPEV